MRVQLQSGPPKTRLEAGWQLANVLRQEGRYTRSASIWRGRYRRGPCRSRRQGQRATQCLSRGTDAVRPRDSTARPPRCSTRSRRSTSDSRIRRRWHGTGSGPGLTWPTHSPRMGDTFASAHLADSVRVLAEASGFARDARLHYHIRGLLLVARGYLVRGCSGVRKGDDLARATGSAGPTMSWQRSGCGSNGLRTQFRYCRRRFAEVSKAAIST